MPSFSQVADVLAAGVLVAYALVILLSVLLQATRPKPKFRSVLGAWRDAWTAVPGGPRFWTSVQLANIGLLIGVVGIILGASTVIRVVLSSVGIVVEVIGLMILARIWSRHKRTA